MYKTKEIRYLLYIDIKTAQTVYKSIAGTGTLWGVKMMGSTSMPSGKKASIKA
jgi:hypothetical protein